MTFLIINGFMTIKNTGNLLNKYRKKYRRTFCEKEEQAIRSLLFYKNKRARQFALLRRGCGEGISSCFLQSNLRTSPTYALQKSSVTAKTVGVYRFLTLFQIPFLPAFNKTKNG